MAMVGRHCGMLKAAHPMGQAKAALLPEALKPALARPACTQASSRRQPHLPAPQPRARAHVMAPALPVIDSISMPMVMREGKACGLISRSGLRGRGRTGGKGREGEG